MDTDKIIDKDRQAWNKAMLAAGIPAINTDTCVKILAVLYVHGNNEDFVFNGRLMADVEYIQERFGIIGGETPDADFAERLKKTIDELERYDRENCNQSSTAIFAPAIPKWAKELFSNNYKIKL